MGNIYSRYGVQNLRPLDISRMVFRGVNHAPKAAAAPKVAPQAFFQNAVQVEPDQAPWVLGGDALGRLGALGGSQLGPLPVEFAEPGAYNEFFNPRYGADGGCDGREGLWDPPSEKVLAKVANKLAALQEAGDEQADAWIATAKRLAASVDKMQKHDGGAFQCGRSDARERQYRTAMTALKRHILSGTKLPDPVPETRPPVSVSVDTGGDTVVKPKPTASVMAKPRADVSTGRAPLVAATGSKLPLVPILAGVGLLVVGGAFFLLRKK